MTPNDIINIVAELTGIPREDITTPCRAYEVCDARHLAIWAIRKLPRPMTHRAIAEMFQFKGLTNAAYSVRKANDLHATDKKFRDLRDEVERRIKAQEVAA